MKILIVEDEQRLADSLARGLRLKGYTTDVLYDGKSALTRIEVHWRDYDLVILDLMLPLVSGAEICERVRSLGITIPILVLTAQEQVDSKVNLLLLGADDYMVKPFSFAELAARVHALLRRPHESVPTVVTAGPLTVNTTTHEVCVDKKPVVLTLKEFALLEYLVRHPNEVVQREDVLSHLWGFDYDSFSNTLDVHVKNLRKKIYTERIPDILETVRGVGYRLRV